VGMMQGKKLGLASQSDYPRHQPSLYWVTV